MGGEPRDLKLNPPAQAPLDFDEIHDYMVWFVGDTTRRPDPFSEEIDRYPYHTAEGWSFESALRHTLRHSNWRVHRGEVLIALDAETATVHAYTILSDAASMETWLRDDAGEVHAAIVSEEYIEARQARDARAMADSDDGWF